MRMKKIIIPLLILAGCWQSFAASPTDADDASESNNRLSVLTPAESPLPRINGPRVFGVRPGHPVLITVAATGTRPITFSSDGLPEGLSLDSETGQLTGALETSGSHVIRVHVKNALGTASRSIRIVCGN